MAKNSKSNRKGLEALAEVAPAIEPETPVVVIEETVQAALASDVVPVAEVVAANVAEVLDPMAEFNTLAAQADGFLTQMLKWNQALTIHNKALRGIEVTKEELKKDKIRQQNLATVDELKRQLIEANVAPTHPTWNAVRRMRQILEDEYEKLIAPYVTQIEAVKPAMAEFAAWKLANDKEWKAWKASYPKGAAPEQ